MKKAIIYSAHGKKYLKESINFANETRKSITDETSLILHTSTDSEFDLKQVSSHPKVGVYPNIPLCFPEFNTGVILFKKTCASLSLDRLNLLVK